MTLSQMLSTFLIVLTITSNSYAAQKEESRFLEEGTPAPFSGYLIPPSTTKELKDAVIERDGFKLINTSLEKSISIYKQNETLYTDKVNVLVNQNDNLAKSLESARSTSDLTKILWFGLGVVATGFAIYGAKAATK